MIGLYLKIPFHAQIELADRIAAAELRKHVHEAAIAFAANLIPIDESFLFAFDEGIRPCRLRAAEAARFLEPRLRALSPSLHGWALLIESLPASPDEALRVLDRMWIDVPGDGLFVGGTARADFSRYYVTSRKGRPGGESPASESRRSRFCFEVLENLYSRPALPAEAELPPPSGPSVELLIDEIGQIGIGARSSSHLAVIGAGRSAIDSLDAALGRLYPESIAFLRIAVSRVRPSPYGPLVDALGSLSLARAGELLSGAERGLLEELSPILDFLRRSPYRNSFTAGLGIRFRICSATALRLYAREQRALSRPAFLVIDGIEDLSSESRSLLKTLLENLLIEEGITVLAAGTALPETWPPPGTRRIQAGGPGASVIEGIAAAAAPAIGRSELASSIARLAGGEAFRLSCAVRLAATRPASIPLLPTAVATADLAQAVLETLPPEYAELLLALHSCEGVMTAEDTEAFLDSIGFVPGIRPLAFEALATLGFIDREKPPRIAQDEAARRASRVLPDGGSAFRADFAARLLRLHESRRIVPSLDFYRQVRSAAGPGASSSTFLRLLLDSLSADAVYGSSEQAAGALERSPLEGFASFLAAYGRADREAAFAALERVEREILSNPAEPRIDPTAASGARIASSMAALARGFMEYADHRAPAAANRAKNALMSLHAEGAERAEAKAHRLLGLCALAQEQLQEGADYLANAYDMAEFLVDPLECMLAAQAEASAYFVIGDLSRSNTRIAAGAAWARRSFRFDWEMGFAFMEGRSAFELGRYTHAEEAFGKVRAEARVYGQPEAATRAEIWTGRSASWAGEAERAREILGRHREDPEALWFLAELESWEGRREEAARLAERAQARVAKPAFASADYFPWDSGFSSMEERAVGFGAKMSYLEDQVRAFTDYAVGLAAGGTVAIEKASALDARSREDRLAANHPAVHLYLFYRYILLEESVPGAMDAVTALSKAFKGLQVRAGRMGEAAHKDGFLEGNRWNRMLFIQSRARKLI